MVSVIIPSYNVEQYISGCLASVLSWTNTEVIVVDDGSTDGTVEAIHGVVHANPGANVKLVQLDQNSGPSRARNVGISQASGDWLFFVDADDIVMPEAKAFASNLTKVENYDVIYPELVVFDERTGAEQLYYQDTLRFSPEQILKTTPLATLLVTNYIGAFAFVSRPAIGDIRFNENLRAYEDWDFWLQLMLNGARFKFEPTPLGKYRIGREGSLSTEILRSHRKFVRGNLQILSFNYQRVQHIPDARKLITRRLRELAVELLLHP